MTEQQLAAAYLADATRQLIEMMQTIGVDKSLLGRVEYVERALEKFRESEEKNV